MEQSLFKESDEMILSPKSNESSTKSSFSYDSEEENSLITAHHNKNIHFSDYKSNIIKCQKMI